MLNFTHLCFFTTLKSQHLLVLFHGTRGPSISVSKIANALCIYMFVSVLLLWFFFQLYSRK